MAEGFDDDDALIATAIANSLGQEGDGQAAAVQATQDNINNNILNVQVIASSTEQLDLNEQQQVDQTQVDTGNAVEPEEIQDIEIKFGMYLTANTRESRRVWTSIGIGMNMKLFLGKLEWLNLQKLNKFWYRAAVGRVQVTIVLEPPFYFTLRTGFDFRDTLFKFNRVTMELESTKKRGFDVRLWRTLQVDMALYALQDGGMDFKRFTDLDNNRVTETVLAWAPTYRFASAMTHYISRYIIVTGGIGGQDDTSMKGTCDVYDISTN